MRPLRRGYRRDRGARKRVDEVRNAVLALAGLLGGALQEIWRAIVFGADAVGRVEVAIARVLSVPLGAVFRGARATLSLLERAVTPTRAVAAVIASAAIVLAVSQFVDYRGIEIGVPLYEAVEAVAPPPQTGREPTGSAHSYLMLPVAGLALVALVFALRGRWQLGRAISVLGLVAIAVSLVVDVPKGLDEGLAARDFEGARATLLEGFWVQLASAAVLVVTGMLLSRYARLQAVPARGRGRRPERGPRRGRSRWRRGRRGGAPAAGASA